MRNFSWALLFLAGSFPSLLLAQSGTTPDQKCQDLTRGRLMGADYESCKSRSVQNMAQLQRALYRGLPIKDPFSGTEQCVKELKESGTKPVSDTRACLNNAKQTAAVEALDQYHIVWEYTISLWKDAAPSVDLYKHRVDSFHDGLVRERLKFEKLIR